MKKQRISVLLLLSLLLGLLPFGAAAAGNPFTDVKASQYYYDAVLWAVEKGAKSVTVTNYYDGRPVTIPLDVRLTPSRNAQKYYTEYRKAANAEAVLRRLIAECEDEITYIESVEEALRRATTEGELLEIREELRQQGYLKAVTPKGQRPLQKRRGGIEAPPFFCTADKFLPE